MYKQVRVYYYCVGVNTSMIQGGFLLTAAACKHAWLLTNWQQLSQTMLYR